MTTEIPAADELATIEELPLEERAAAMEALEQRLRDALEDDTEA